jgi:hypothetical protein
MNPSAKVIIPFLGSKNFQESTEFYELLGWKAKLISKGFARVYIQDKISFYLQDYYSKEWCENTMVFLEMDDLENQRESILMLDLPEKFPGVKVSKIKKNEWGDEFFLHDPAGILWHIGFFNS